MSSHARRVRRMSTVAGVVLLIAGVIAIVAFVMAQQHAPQPPASAAKPITVTPRSSSTPPPSGSAASIPPAAPSPTAVGPILPRSMPVSVRIPAIHVDSVLGPIGLTGTGEIQTPPLDRNSHAYWLDVSPTPGQQGPSVILGHVDSAAYGPAVFFRLGAMRQGDKIYVTRADHRVAVFEVQRVLEYTKTNFPTLAVYGNTDYAALRLITCGGTFDESIHSYESNIVVYAELVSSAAA